MSVYSWPDENTLVPREEVKGAIESFSREPFADVLEALLQSRPSRARMLAWASEAPDKWANAIKIFALLAGYTEKTETIHKHIHLHKLSDAELIQATQEMITKDPSLLGDLKNIHESKLAQEQAQLSICHESRPIDQISNASIDADE